MLKIISRLPLTIIELHGDLVCSPLRFMVLVLIIILAATSGMIAPSLANTTIFNGKVGGIAAWMIGVTLEYLLGVITVSSVTICTSLIAAKLLPGLYKKIDQRRGFYHLCVAYSLIVIPVTCVICHHFINSSFMCFQCWLDCLSPKAVPGALFWGLVTSLVKSFVRVLVELRKAKETNGVVIKKGNDPEDHDDSATPPFGLAV